MRQFLVTLSLVVFMPRRFLKDYEFRYFLISNFISFSMIFLFFYFFIFFIFSNILIINNILLIILSIIGIYLNSYGRFVLNSILQTVVFFLAIFVTLFVAGTVFDTLFLSTLLFLVLSIAPYKRVYHRYVVSSIVFLIFFLFALYAVNVTGVYNFSKDLQPEQFESLSYFRIVIFSSVAFLLFICFFMMFLGVQQSKALESRTRSVFGSFYLDRCTGLGNIYAFEKYLRNALQEIQLSNRQLCLIYFDIDDFKKVVSIRGNADADIFIKDIAHLIQNRFFKDRKILFRIEGDKFAIVLQDSSMQQAQHLVADISEFLKVQDFSLQFPITASFGIFQPNLIFDYKKICESTEIILYLAKKKGKDGIAYFREEDFD